jgi:4-hydroxy-3-polyprenylbenzoate decarboxylase
VAKQDGQADGMSTGLGGDGSASPRIGSNTAPHLAYHDLRKWLEEAQKLGEVKEVRGLSWQSDIGMVSEMAYHTDNAPCFVFKDIPGSLPGSRILVNFFDGKRKNMTLGFPTDMSKIELSEGFRKHYTGDLKHIPPKFVETGPVMQNVMTGDAIDVTKFPAPKWHHKDGGRYIGTGCYNIIRDPDEGWINCGTYRVMIHDRKSAGFYISPGKHGRIMRDKYESRGEQMAVAIVVGGDPMMFLMACSEVPYGISEYAICGGIRGKAMEVVKGKVTGLPFPANAEIVLEGYVQPGNKRPEGPFGEWTGYYTSSQNEPVLRVKAVYYRSDPILCGFPLLRPSSGDNLHHCLIRSAQIWNALDDAGVPEIKAVWVHPAAGRFLTVLSIRQRYPGHAKQAAMIASQCRAGAYLGRYVIVVDDDIDITKSDDVIWALCSRSDPVRSIDILRRCWSGPLDPAIRREEKGFNSRAIIDATRPYEWRDTFPAVSGHSVELKAEVKRKWAHLMDKRPRRGES